LSIDFTALPSTVDPSQVLFSGLVHMADAKLLEKARDCVKKKNYVYAFVNFINHLKMTPGDLAARKELREAERAQKKAAGGGGFMAGAKKKMLEMKAMGIMLSTKDPEKTMHACEELLQEDPDNSAALLKLGEAASHAKLNEVAIQAFEDVLATDKENKHALRLMGRVLYAIENHERALKCFQKLAKLDPKDKEADDQCRNIPASMTAKKVKEGVDKGGYQNLIDKSQAQALEKANKRVRTPEEALERISELEPVVEKNPKDTKTMRLIAELYIKAERVDDAIAWADKALAADPNDFLASELKGDILMQRLEAGLSKLEEAYRKTPGDEKVKAKLAKAKQEKLAFDLVEYRKRVDAHPTEYGLRYVLGKAYYDAEQYDEAIKELQQAKNDARKKADAGYYLGQCFVKKKIYKLALTELQGAREGLFEMDDLKKGITYLMGRIYEQAGKKDEANKAYSEIAEVDFGYKDVTKRLEALS